MNTKERYKRARATLTRRVRLLKKRGYVFEKNPVPKIPKRITEGSVRRIENITLNKLYDQSSIYLPDIGKVSGTVGRGIKRREAGHRASQTRKLNEILKTIPEREFEAEDADDKFESNDLSFSDESEYDAPDDYDTPDDYFSNRAPYQFNKVLRYMLDALKLWVPSATWTSPFYREKRESYVEEIARIIDNALETDGFDAVAIRCEEKASSITHSFDRVLYDSGDKNDPNWLDTNLSYIIAVIQGGNLSLAENAFLTEYGEEQSV